MWLLEKTRAREKFLVFGNDREVSVLWLKRYGDLVTDVAFFFLHPTGDLERLNGSISEQSSMIDTFPVIHWEDEAQFGEYRMKRMVLEAYDKLEDEVK